jgi:hypothetical protein
MSTARPFAYNTGAPIAGTIQVGSLAVGTPTSGFTTNPTFWNGPDEELGYVIAYPVSGGTHPTPIFGVTAYLGFLGTKNMANPLDESTFVELTNNSFNQSFTNGNDASTWLTNNGYWNSWISVTPTPTATLGVTPTPTPTSAATGNFNVTVLQVGSDVVWSGSGSFNLDALTSAGASTIGGGYNSASGAWAIGPNAPVDTYSGAISNPGGFGTSQIPVTSNTGSTFGILGGGLILVPSGYVSNTNISGTSTYTNTTIAGAGLTPGVYTWSWGSGGNASTLVMTIS